MAKPVARRYIPSEEDEQKAVFMWTVLSRSKYPEAQLLYAIPNGGKRDAITGRHLKETGVKAGVPDMCLPVARGGYHGLYIELKRLRGGKLSQAQIDWLAWLTDQGYLAEVCYGADEAVQAIKQYLKLAPA